MNIFLHEVNSRIAKLEAQNRRLKLASTLAGIVGVSFLFTAARPTDRVDPSVIRARVVEVQDLVLKDERGQVFARLTVKERTERQNQLGPMKTTPAMLEFYDENGDVAATVPVTGGFLPVK